DLVVSNYALHHLTDDDKVALVARASRWLRPGGRLVVADMMFGRGASERDRAIIRHKPGGLGRPATGGRGRSRTTARGLGGAGAPSRHRLCGGPLVHRVEQGTFNPKVPGSRPGRPTQNPS